MIKIVCPVCGAVSYADSLEHLLKETEKDWKHWEPYMTQSQKKRIQLYNNPKRLQAILDAQGYLNVFCESCIIATIRALGDFRMFDWFRRLCSTLYNVVRRNKAEHNTTHYKTASAQQISNKLNSVLFGDVHLREWQIQRRVKDARSKRRHLKPAPKHFPSSPAFEKCMWDKKKKMEEN